MRLAVSLVLFGALAACAPTATISPAPPPAPAAPDVGMSGAEVEATALCVRENATEGELALMALGGERAQTATAQVLGRPATLDCLSRAGVQLPGQPAS
jgi:hypothetical protein